MKPKTKTRTELLEQRREKLDRDWETELLLGALEGLAQLSPTNSVRILITRDKRK